VQGQSGHALVAPVAFLNWAFLILAIILVTEFGLFVSNE
jgi:hypothetical protein